MAQSHIKLYSIINFKKLAEALYIITLEESRPAS